MDNTALATAGFAVPPDVHARLERFLTVLLEENSKVNLTAIRTLERAWPLHICDSLGLLPLLQAEPRPRTILDLGSGPGIPGIPLAIAMPDVQVTLLDATRKKVAAAERIIASLELPNVTAVWGRAETRGHEPELRERFDVVVSRALGALPFLCEYAAGFVAVGGQCLFMKSVDGARGEVDQATQAARVCSLESIGYSEYSLPDPHGERVVVVYQKTGPLSRRLPRSPGAARKRPL